MLGGLSVAIAAGGTAGHINPALALAEELTRRGHKVRFFGQPTRLEATLVPAAGFAFEPIKVTGFDRARPWTAITAMWRMRAAEHTVGQVFAAHCVPDVAVGFGAYVEMALVRWCCAHRVPYVLHEQNSVPGLANKLCARNAACLCLSFPTARVAFKGHLGANTRVVETGNPVRRSVTSVSRRQGRNTFGVPQEAELLLVFGGSLGARHLNEGVVALKDELLARKNLRVIHSTGVELYDETVAALALSPKEMTRWQVMPYINDMGGALAAADLVLSRAGASSIAEIAALAVPALLVPYPFATKNHQATNARLLSDIGAALVCDDAAIGTPEFTQKLLSLIDNADRRETMRAAARSLSAIDAACALADQIEEAAAS